jgi:O-acetyl-ADP-ribose deacetylase (regulator of RNase III)
VITVRGDLIQLSLKGEFSAIVHGCNCFCTMGAGIARLIKCAFPDAYKADCSTRRGDKQKLGTCTSAKVTIGTGQELTIINAYTQYNYGRNVVNVDYDALRRCLRWIATRFQGKKIGLPRIGCGLAGGDWKIVSKIIDEELKDCDVTYVEYG